jgi:ubiquinol-cytochrome c reductase cytochrome b subunit
LPLLIAGLIGLHLHLVLRNGISEPPFAGQPVDPASYRASYDTMLVREGVPFWPNAAWRDVTFGVLVVAGVAVLGLLIGAPALDRPPDPSMALAQPRPDWYLLWYFAVLALLPHAAENYVMVLAPLLVGLILLSPPFLSNRGERSMRHRPWAPLLVLFAVTCIGVLWRAGVRERWMTDFAVLPLTAESVGAESGRLPAGTAVFNTKGCLYCHAISGHGGTRGPDLTEVGQRLTRDQIVVRILNGGPNMPAYANNMTPQQLDALTVFLESRFHH